MSALIVIAKADSHSSMIMSSYLSSAGYQVVRAADGKTAWKMVAEQAPSALLLDPGLPGMSSELLLAMIRSHRDSAEMPVILLGNPGTTDEIVHWFRLGIDGYIDEPCSPYLLLAQIDSLVRRVEEWNAELAEKRKS